MNIWRKDSVHFGWFYILLIFDWIDGANVCFQRPHSIDSSHSDGVVKLLSKRPCVRLLEAVSLWWRGDRVLVSIDTCKKDEFEQMIKFNIKLVTLDFKRRQTWEIEFGFVTVLIINCILSTYILNIIMVLCIGHQGDKNWFVFLLRHNLYCNI